MNALALAVVVTAAMAGAPPAYDSSFWRAWGDGQAEIDGYALVRDRYGEKRSGTVVAVFVTEPWSASAHVKADDGKHDKGDVIQVLKLNAVEDFQTGIYDYNLMTSSWTSLTSLSADAPSASKAEAIALGTAPKIVFTAQEWCGTTYSDVVIDRNGAAELVRSYFDGESGMRMMPPPPTPTTTPASTSTSTSTGEPLVEDSLLVWARGLAAPVVKPGETVTVAFLPALARARLTHKKLVWTTATLTRASGEVAVDVPAGRLTCANARVEVAASDAGPARTVDVCVESAAPHRVVQLTSSDGYALALTGTVRTAYWQKNHEGDEAILTQIGLHPPRSR